MILYATTFVTCPYCKRKVVVSPIFGASPTSAPPIRGFTVKEHRCEKKERK